MKSVFEKIIEQLEELRKAEIERDDLCDEEGYGDSEEIYEDGKSQGRFEQVVRIIKIVKQEAEQYNNGWIPVEEELPKDCDNRYYMCIVENHEEYPPMYCQYDEECGFGFYQDIYDEHTLGFVDSEFRTNEELGYEKVIAWQQLLPYQPKGE